MVDATKSCLVNVYNEAHDRDAPFWRKLEDLVVKTDQIKLELLDSSSPDQNKVIPSIFKKIFP